MLKTRFCVFFHSFRHICAFNRICSEKESRNAVLGSIGSWLVQNLEYL